MTILNDLCKDLLDLADDPPLCNEAVAGAVRDLVNKYLGLAAEEAEADHIIDTYPGY